MPRSRLPAARRPEEPAARRPPWPAPPAASPYEQMAGVVLLMVGILARTLAAARCAVEHFDEGVYASNIFFGPPDYAYPLQALYAPPLLPALIETGMLVGLPPNLAALLPAWIAGNLTLVLLWWSVRTWLGPSAALAALALAACSDLHLMLSTAALTDGCLWLWVLLAVVCARRALLAGDLRWAVAGGLACGLAWWTKYNGWLPLAIVAAAAPLAFCLGIRSQEVMVRWLKVAAVMAIVAGVVFLPCLVSLQAIGGYRAVAANHAGYVVGLAGWPESAWQHLAQQRQLQSWLGPLGVCLAVLLASPTRRHWHAGGVAKHVLLAAAAGLAAWWLGTFPLLGIAACMGLARSGWNLFRSGRGRARSTTSATEEPTSAHESQVVTWSLIAAWWLGLLVATPCYTPYARLALGWVVASWLAAGLHVAHPPRVQSEPDFNPLLWWPFGAIFVAVILGLSALAGLQVAGQQALMPSYLPRLGARGLARKIVQEFSSDPTRVVYVYGDPALFFQLRVAGEPLAVPVAAVPTRPAEAQGQLVATYLVVGSYAQRDPTFQRLWLEHASHWQLVGQHTWRPSALVWLDWEDARKRPAVRNASVMIYRFRD